MLHPPHVQALERKLGHPLTRCEACGGHYNPERHAACPGESCERLRKHVEKVATPSPVKSSDKLTQEQFKASRERAWRAFYGKETIEVSYPNRLGEVVQRRVRIRSTQETEATESQPRSVRLELLAENGEEDWVSLENVVWPVELPRDLIEEFQAQIQRTHPHGSCSRCFQVYATDRHTECPSCALELARLDLRIAHMKLWLVEVDRLCSRIAWWSFFGAENIAEVLERRDMLQGSLMAERRNVPCRIVMAEQKRDDLWKAMVSP